MCDTLVVRPEASANGALLFAKNSDREANEAQYLLHVPAARHAPGSRLACTYIEIDQAPSTYSVLLSKPFWMWGAEMGSNEHGLIIGNEAVHAKIKPQAEEALLGMDLLRLALERAKTTDEALHVITSLLARHGQGGNCAHLGRFEYHNSFLIADAAGEALVLETVGREWAYERVTRQRSISNSYTIGTRMDGASPNLVTQAQALGFAREGEVFDLAEAYANRHRSALATGTARWCRTSQLLNARGRHNVKSLMQVLRDHGASAARNPQWRPDGAGGGTVCAHASWGPVRRFGQTTASWVASISPGQSVHWVTGTSAPDTGIFKPVFFGPGFANAPLPDFGPAPRDRYDGRTLWWRHERLHRAVLADYAGRLPLYAEARDRLEGQFVERVEALLARDAGPAAAAALARTLWREAEAAEKQWLRLVLAEPPRAKAAPSAPFRAHWQALSHRAHMPIESSRLG